MIISISPIKYFLNSTPTQDENFSAEWWQEETCTSYSPKVHSKCEWEVMGIGVGRPQITGEGREGQVKVVYRLGAE